MQGSFRSIFRLISSLFYVSSVGLQLLVNNELFHQSRFYLKNDASSVQLLFKQLYFNFSPGEKSGGNVRGKEYPRPLDGKALLCIITPNCGVAVVELLR